VGGEITTWGSVKPSVKRVLLTQVIFEKKKSLFNLYELSLKKEVELSIFKTRNYFIENILQQ
jgi:hypothetical protein